MIRIAITTYNRPAMLERLVNRLFDEDGYKLDVYIYDDGSDEAPSVPGCTVHTYEHGGARGFYRLWNGIMQDAQEAHDWARLIVLPDDVDPMSGFLGRSTELYDAIDDKHKVAMGLLTDEERRGKASWTDFVPRVVETSAGKVYHTQWTEHALICGRRFVDAMPHMYSLPERAFITNPLRSSGVGAHISRAMDSAGFHIYQAFETLLHHGDHESLMHPELRKEERLTTK